jgi:prepilin-type processing-associated H-X9-DG protein
MTPICVKFGVRTNNVRHSWAVFVLPFIEQGNVSKLYDINSDWASTANQVARETQLKAFVCPSAPGGTGRMNAKTVNGIAILAAAGDYAPNNGYGSALESAGLVDVTPGANRAGVLQVNQSWSIPEIPDGTSNTLLLSEDAGRPDRHQNGKMISAGTQTDGGWADHDCEYVTHGFTADGITSPGPCHTNCSNNNEVYSFHTGGANHVFADGSVRYIPTSMDIRVFVKLLTRAGQDIVPGNF